MMQRFDLISPRPRRDGGTHWQKIGAAFPRDKGGFSLVFDALPLPDAEGRVSVLMTEPKPRDNQQGGYDQSPSGHQAPASGGYGAPAPGGNPADPLDSDDIPFSYEWRG